MRAYEIVTEAKGKTNPEHSSTMQPSMVVHDMDPGYDYYRFMIKIAGYPQKNAAHDHEHFRDHPVMTAYTQAEEDMLSATVKGMGKKASWITTENGKEPSSNNKKSPVAFNSGARKKK
jgi:ABC-type uncharacterized transport system YnjBCD substrate-binding protein